MTRYTATYVRVTYAYGQDTVEADTPEAAEAAAVAKIEDGELFLDWQTDEQEQRLLYIEPAQE